MTLAVPAIAVILLVVLTACSQPLPRYSVRSAADSLAVLARRSDEFRSLSASGTLTLRSPEHGGITLDVAVVARRPDQLRIRAWKLGRSAADIQLYGNEVRFTLDERVDEESMIDCARSIQEALLFLDAEYYLRAIEQPSTDRSSLVIRGVVNSGVRLWCEIDRATLTTRRIWVESEKSATLDGEAVIAHLSLERYRVIDGMVYPTRVRAVRDNRSATLRFDWVEMNAEIAPGALPPLNQVEGGS